MSKKGYGGSVDWKERAEDRYETILELNKRITELQAQLEATEKNYEWNETTRWKRKFWQSIAKP